VASVSTYLNFQGNTEEAFTFYASVFGTEFSGPIVRFKDVGFGTAPGMPELTDDELNKIMHIELPIVAGHVLMATDMLESLGHNLRIGNNTTINLTVDTREEADRLFGLLGKDSAEFAPMATMPWGQYWGSALDRFGVRWMFSAPL
jgi:PhnB protein